MIRDDGRTLHHTKRGTPTMGGAVIIVASLVGVRRSRTCSPSRRRRCPACSCCSSWPGWALVGFLDDYIKIFKQRSLGLRGSAKIGGQLVGVIFAVLALQFPNGYGLTPGLAAHLVPPRHHVDLAFAGTLSGRCCSSSGRTS